MYCFAGDGGFEELDAFAVGGVIEFDQVVTGLARVVLCQGDGASSSSSDDDGLGPSLSLFQVARPGLGDDGTTLGDGFRGRHGKDLDVWDAAWLPLFYING